MICKNDVCKYYDENWPGNCKSRPDAEKCGSFLRETPLKNQTEPVDEVPCGDGLGADADYAYKDIAEFEEIIKCKVNDAFRDGWNMARTTNKQLRALAGAEEGP